MSRICALDGGSVHRISSGQAIFDLAAVVKELIENCLDAGASKIDVRLKDYGVTSIEVVDNGSGISCKDYKLLAKRHSTSKLATFEDLDSLSTFGFRGEALSSLCALADLQVTTCTKDDEIGSILKFDGEGDLVTQSQTSCPVGTTISVYNFLNTFPVRHTDLKRNVKKYYTKLVVMLQTYAIVCKGIRLTCSNEMKGGSRSTIFNAQGASYKENIATVFGGRQLTLLDEVKVALMSNIKLNGFISRAVPGKGRSASDRQLFYINNRPVHMDKLKRVINKVYKTYNGNQYPVVIFMFTIPPHLFDVNLTPDKMSTFLQNESALFNEVQNYLHEKFEPAPSQLTVHDMRGFVTSQPKLNDVGGSSAVDIRESTQNAKSTQVDGSGGSTYSSGSSSYSSQPLHNSRSITSFQNLKKKTQLYTLNPNANSSSKSPKPKPQYPSAVADFLSAFKRQRVDDSEDNVISPNKRKRSSPVTPELQFKRTSFNKRPGDNVSASKSPNSSARLSRTEEFNFERDEKMTDVETVVPFSMLALRSLVGPHCYSKDTSLAGRASKLGCGATESDIGGIAPVVAAEDLERIITKKDFLEMEIVGQFNLGFIVTRLGADLFLVDQHAADEKYRFETLQKTTTINSQVLFNPKKLDVTPAMEITITDNLDVFKKNGFGIVVDDTQEASKRLSLASLPYSKNTVFGVDDVYELAANLQECSSKTDIYRPTKIRAMFASRSCRSAIMIGDALTAKEMKQVIRNMAELDQPWNCPHGRPTLRHLFDLTLLSTIKELAESASQMFGSSKSMEMGSHLKMECDAEPSIARRDDIAKV